MRFWSETIFTGDDVWPEPDGIAASAIAEIVVVKAVEVEVDGSRW